MRRLPHFFIVLLYFGAMGYAAFRATAKPYFNWDMLCYMGSVISWSERDPEQIHRKTMDSLKQNIPDWVYQQHAENILSRDYKAFNTIIPLCQIKPLYTGSVWLAHQTGLALPQASAAVSCISFCIIAVLGFIWRPLFMHASALRLLIVGATFLGDFPLRSLAHLSTPDALGTMLTFAAFFAWLQKKSFWGFCLLGWLATLARPDAMIIISAAAGYFTLLAPQELKIYFKQGVIMIGLLVTSYLSFKYAFGNYTFDQYFIHSLVQLSTNPGAITQKLTLGLYLWILQGSFISLMQDPRVIVLLLLSVMAFASLYLKPKPQRRIWRDLLLLTIVCWNTRFLLWPTYEYRFYYAYTLMILLTAGETIAPFVSFIRQKSIEQRKADLTKPADSATSTV